MTDEVALALTIWGEARGEPIESKIGVAMVVRNRVKSRYFGDITYVDVCMRKAQFSAWSEEARQMHQAELSLDHPDATLRLCIEIAHATIAGRLADNTNGANHYYAVSIAPPSWAAGQFALARLGKHAFYKVA